MLPKTGALDPHVGNLAAGPLPLGADLLEALVDRLPGAPVVLGAGGH